MLICIASNSESPVIYQIQGVYLQKQHQLFQMSTTINSSDIWEQLLRYTRETPLNFEKFEDQYDIKKLDLKKITALEIRSKRILFEDRTTMDSETAKTWMENQFRIFIWFLLAYCEYNKKCPERIVQSEWNFIANIFRKFPYVCQYFFYCTLKKKSHSWLPEEDEIITSLMKSELSKKWTSIGLELFRLTKFKSVKKPKAIRQRWLSHLNPDIKRDGWTVDEELQLLQKMKEYGKKWSKIASVLGNRSEHTIKNRFNKLMTRLISRDEHLKQYESEEIICILAKDLRKRQDESRKSKKFQSSQQLAEEVIGGLPSQQMTVQTQEVTETRPKLNYIFNPIIITLGGFSLE